MKVFSAQRLYAKLLLISLLFLGISTALGASSDVDLSFNAHLSKDIIYTGAGFNGSMIVQPDGKVLIYGGFRVVNGVAVNRLIRLNTDGTIDGTFNCLECNKFSMSNALLQPDGKIIVAGAQVVGSFAKSKTIRINADGSLDPSFTVQLSETGQGVNYSTVLFGLQADGKIFIGQNSQQGGFSGVLTYRLNPNGSIDTSFTPFNTNTRLGRGFVSGIKQLSDGKLYVYGATAFGAFARLNADGTEDTTYEKPSFTTDTFGVSPSVTSIAVQADGKVVIAGNFITINGISKKTFGRLNPGGSLDLAFTELPDALVSPVRQYADGKLLVSRVVDIPAGFVLPTKLTANGALDSPALNLPANLITTSTFEITADNKIYLYGVFDEKGKLLHKLVRLNADGSLDTSFNASIALRGTVNGLAIQTDGKVVKVGNFDRVNGISQPTIARVNTNGSLDTSFSTGSGFNLPPLDVTIDPNGKLYVNGDFTSYNGTPVSNLVRLLPDGSLDSGFNLTVNNTVNVVTFQPDGKIFIGGIFTLVNGQAVKGIARLNADGSFDSSFAPVFGSGGQINSIFVQTDGKIMVGGSFFGVGGFNRQNLARLNPDGSLDNTFNAGAISTVKQVAQISGGKYYVAISKIQKLNSDGTVDPTFASPTFGNSSSSTLGLRFLVLPGEGLLVVGDYNLVDNTVRRGITALFPNGQWANQTYPVGANGSVFDIVRQTDGKIIIGGDFDLFEYVPRAGVARLSAPSLTKITPFDYDGDGRSDVSVFRASENKWYILQSSNLQVVERIFAAAGDIPVPSDYDGDGKTDYAIFRPSSGDWWYLSSINNAQINVHFGQSGDIPKPSDFDGDGKTDFVVYRPSNGIWYRYGSTGVTSNLAFGAAGDQPLIGDFDGDGKTEPAIFRPSTGDWWYRSSISGQFITVHWGASGDIPVPGDYDADGKTDFVVFRPSDGGWYILYSSGSYTIAAFGTSGDKPIAADYDGDGKTDVAVFRPSTGTWYLLQTTAGFGAVNFGVSSDIPTENAFVP